MMVAVNGNYTAGFPGLTASATPNRKWNPKQEIGTAGLRRYGQWIDEEFDPALRGQRGAQKFSEMRRNDPDIGAILTAIEMSILSVEWQVQPGGESAKDDEAKEFLESCMSDMSHSWTDLLSEACSMFCYGWAYLEEVYKIRAGRNPSGAESASSKFDDGRIGWRKIAIRSQESLSGWEFDEHGSFRGMWQQAPLGGNRVFIPIEKAVLFRTSPERGNPEGYSLLRNAYRPWFIKTNMEEIEVISAERDMTGIPYIKLPVGATEEDKNAALDILEQLKWDEQAGVVLPRNGMEEQHWWDFGTVASPGPPRIDIDKVVQRQTISIARAVLAQFLTLGQGRVGSYALSRDFQDFFHLAVKGYLDRMEDTINRFMVERLFALNDFKGLTEIPRITHGRVGRRDLASYAEALSKLGALGLPFLKEDWDAIRKELEFGALPDDWEEEEENPFPPEGQPGQQPPQPPGPSEPEEGDPDQIDEQISDPSQGQNKAAEWWKPWLFRK